MCVAARNESVTLIYFVLHHGGGVTLMYFVLQHGVGVSLLFTLYFSMEWECHYPLLCVAAWSRSIAIKSFVFKMEWELCYKMLHVSK